MRNALDDAVDDFISEVGAALADVSDIAGRPISRDRARSDAASEAFTLSSAVLDADGRLSDEQLWGLIRAFAGRLRGSIAGSTPSSLRQSGLLANKESGLSSASSLFATLCAADRKTGGAYARTYYHRAVRLAHATAALDRYTSRTELEAIERFRTLLLGLLPAGRGGLGNGVATPAGQNDSPTAAHTDAATATETTEEATELPPPRPIEELLAELDELVGLDGVKAEVKLVTNLLQVQKLRTERELPVLDLSRHLVFTGNPGTGKTTVARLLAQIYRTLEVVAKGHLIETDRAALVAGFVGQTAIKVTEVFDSADEGVLLIDEAYALARGGERDFGREAIDTLVKLIEDRRDRVVVIAAGYPDEMSDFVDSNPGLSSRFPKTIHFADYSTDELVKIFGLIGAKNQYNATEDAVAKLTACFDAQPRDKGFGNGRLARNLFEDAVARHATRVVGITDLTDEDLTTLTVDDIPDIPGTAAAIEATPDGNDKSDG